MTTPQTYSESAKGVTITKARALKELRDHGVTDSASVSDFLTDMGDHETYQAHAVLVWLGY